MAEPTYQGGGVKVNESECDFCGKMYPFLIPVNDGAWAICADCYATTEIKEEEE